MKTDRQYIRSLRIIAKRCKLVLKGMRIILHNTHDKRIKKLCEHIAMNIYDICVIKMKGIQKRRDDNNFKQIMRNLGL